MSRWPFPPWFSLRVCQLRYSELAPPARRSNSGHCLVQTGRALPAAPMMVMFWPMSLGDAIQWADLGDIIP